MGMKMTTPLFAPQMDGKSTKTAVLIASALCATLLASCGNDAAMPEPAHPPKLEVTAPKLPSIDDRAQWDRLAETEEGRSFIQKSKTRMEPRLPHGSLDGQYMEFFKSGRREPFSPPYQKRRSRLNDFALSECMENKGLFLPAIEELITDICAERTWVYPFHDLQLKNFNGETTEIDLGAAERGAVLSVVCTILEPRLKPETRELIRDNVKRRIITPFKKMVAKEMSRWWLDGDNNWTAVCLANVTAAGLYMAETDDERLFFATKPVEFIRNYLKSFSADGYCTEGASYWNYGFGNYIYFAELTRRATKGAIDPMFIPEAQKAALFPFRTEIAKGAYPSFADSHIEATPSGKLMGYISKRYGLTCTELEKLVEQPADSPFPLACTLWFPYPETAKPPAGLKEEASTGVRTWFPEAEILICRDDAGVKGDFGAVFKGGANAGWHHHDDAGSYSIVCGGVPVICDPGSEVYTKRTFSPERLQSKVINSYGHPVPLIDGQIQKDGAEAKATQISKSFTGRRDEIVLDMKAAYDVKQLKRLTRAFRFDRDAPYAEIEDSFEFDPPGTFENAIISFGDFERLDDRRLKVSWEGRSAMVEIASGCGAVSMSAERIQEEMPNKLKPLRIAIRTNATATQGRITIRISPVAMK